jgi:hypothetical protein
MAHTVRRDPEDENTKKRKPYYGERRVKTGNLKADQRKLRDMMRDGKPRKAGK